MLNKLFTNPLELQIGEQRFKFCSVADFEFAMAGRTSVPSRKITDMVKFSIRQLEEEAQAIKQIEKRFVNILSTSIVDTQGIQQAMQGLDPLIFSSDHGWRDIIRALNEADDNFSSFRRIAMVKYMQYLASRQDIIKYLYKEKQNSARANGAAGDAGLTSFKDTALLNDVIFEPLAAESTGAVLERMPKGEAITLVLPVQSEVEVRISKHACRLVALDDAVKFIDQDGKTHDLAEGRNIVGRDNVSTIVMDPRLCDVSRLHLLMENIDNHTLQLTDLSSHGTFIPSRYMESEHMDSHPSH